MAVLSLRVGGVAAFGQTWLRLRTGGCSTNAGIGHAERGSIGVSGFLGRMERRSFQCSAVDTVGRGVLVVRLGLFHAQIASACVTLTGLHRIDVDMRVRGRGPMRSSVDIGEERVVEIVDATFLLLIELLLALHFDEMRRLRVNVG